MTDARLQVLEEARRLLNESDASPNEREYLLRLLDLLVVSIVNVKGEASIVESAHHVTDEIISNHHLLTLLRQQADELDALKKLSLNLTSSLDLSTVLHAVVIEAMRLVKNARTAHIFLYINGSLEFGAALDSKGNRDKVYAKPRLHGLTYTVARKGEAILVEDMSNHPLYEGMPPTWSGSIIGIPLKIGEDVVGVMNLSRSIRGGFSPAELRLLQLLADQASVAVFNARLHEIVSQQANSDTITGLPNRRALDEHLDEEILKARRTGFSFAVNDNYGHATGDDVLRVAFNYLATGLRSSDFLARYGGDELTLILSQTDLSSALIVAEKMVEKFEGFKFKAPNGDNISLSMSGGIALYPVHAVTAASLLRSADEALYRAKKHNRGSFVVARGPTGQLVGETS
jgi:diguanylate cyclase (GGDEF)-like protein